MNFNQRNLRRNDVNTKPRPFRVGAPEATSKPLRYFNNNIFFTSVNVPAVIR